MLKARHDTGGTSTTRAGWPTLLVVVLSTMLITVAVVRSRSAPEAAASPAASTAGVTVPAAIGEGPEASFFHPMKPCRIVDTREAGGKLAPNTVRDFRVTGHAGFHNQKLGDIGCNIAHDATSVVVSMTATESTGEGRLTLFASGSPVPTSTTMTYYGDRKMTVGSIVPLGPGRADRLQLKNWAYSTHVVIDVSGYFAPQIVATVDGTDAHLISHSSQVLSSTKLGVGSYFVDTHAWTTPCTAHAFALESGYIASATTVVSEVSVSITDLAGNLADADFNLRVTC